MIGTFEISYHCTGCGNDVVEKKSVVLGGDINLNICCPHCHTWIERVLRNAYGRMEWVLSR